MKVLIAILLGFGLATAIIYGLTTNPKAETYRACLKAHNEINTQSEQKCANLLDKYNLTFKCSDKCRIGEL